MTLRGRVDGDTVGILVEALELLGQRNPCITLYLVGVDAVSDAAVKTLFCYHVEQETQGRQLTILTTPRLQRRLAVCHTTLASSQDTATNDTLITKPPRGLCTAPRPTGAPPRASHQPRTADE